MGMHWDAPVSASTILHRTHSPQQLPMDRSTQSVCYGHSRAACLAVTFMTQADPALVGHKAQRIRVNQKMTKIPLPEEGARKKVLALLILLEHSSNSYKSCAFPLPPAYETSLSLAFHLAHSLPPNSQAVPNSISCFWSFFALFDSLTCQVDCIKESLLCYMKDIAISYSYIFVLYNCHKSLVLIYSFKKDDYENNSWDL